MTREGDDPTAFEFAPSTALPADLRAAVDGYFARTGSRRRGGTVLHRKAAVVTIWLVASYVALVFVASSWWQVVVAALSLALAMAAVGFNVQHDANHGSFSDRHWVNRAAGFSADVMGASSYLWRRQHNTLHHRYTNLAVADYDIETGGAARLSPAQPWRPHHRYQHVYLWVLYGLFVLKWQLVEDFVQAAQGRIGPHPVARPAGADLATFVAGKVLIFVLAFAVPLALHSWTVVVPVYLATMVVLGVLLSLVFVMAHANDAVEHPADHAPAVLPDEWAAHQLATTVDFATGNRVLGWYLGGLNFQVIHHLFPKVAHTHYPALAPLVAEVATRHGVAYRCHPTVRAAVASHYRFLRECGRRPAAVAAPAVA